MTGFVGRGDRRPAQNRSRTEGGNHEPPLEPIVHVNPTFEKNRVRSLSRLLPGAVNSHRDGAGTVGAKQRNGVDHLPSAGSIAKREPVSPARSS